FHAQPLQQVRHPLLREDAHQIVFEREVEARRSGIALAAGAATKLVVEAARLVAFGAENVQATSSNHLAVLNVSLLLVAIEGFVPLLGGDNVLVPAVVPLARAGVVDP